MILSTEDKHSNESGRAQTPSRRLALKAGIAGAGIVAAGLAAIPGIARAAKLPEGDGYLAALTNFRYMANAVWTTDEAVARISAT